MLCVRAMQGPRSKDPVHGPGKDPRPQASSMRTARKRIRMHGTARLGGGNVGFVRAMGSTICWDPVAQLPCYTRV